MIKRDFTIDIKAPLDKVFAFTTDFRKFVKWQDGVTEAAQSPDGPTRLGTILKLTRTFLGQPMEAEGVVTEFIPGQRCAFKTTSGPIALNVVQNFQSTSEGTRLTVHLEAQPGGFLKLAEGSLDRQLTAVFEAQVKKLKAVLES